MNLGDVAKKQRDFSFFCILLGIVVKRAYNDDIESISKGFGMQLSTFRRKKMKKQALAIAIASALVATPSFAAQDTAGMHYTSASEGFYASLRMHLDTGKTSNDTTSLSESASRVGLRGSNDLGGGLEGFYQWEGGVKMNAGGYDGQPWHVRVGHVGLRGAFGSFWVGSAWSADYNWTHGSTDIANFYSGNLSYSDNREARTSNSIEYTTPDLNGFQGAIRTRVVGGDDDNDIDAWNIAANYAVQGFSVAGAYNVRPDGIDKIAEGDTTGDPDSTGMDDANSWTFKLGYSQDNWYVNGWYGEDNTSDEGYLPGTPGEGAVAAVPGGKAEDATFFSIGGGVSVDKVNLYALYEQREDDRKREDSYGTIGAQYNLGSQSRVWIEYTSNDYDSDPMNDDYVNIGMRHDF